MIARVRPRQSDAPTQGFTPVLSLRSALDDLSNLLRLEGVARRAITLMRQLAGEVRGEAQPTLTLEEHPATFAGVEPRSAREPAGRGRTAPRQRNATGRRGRPRRQR